MGIKPDLKFDKNSVHFNEIYLNIFDIYKKILF